MNTLITTTTQITTAYSKNSAAADVVQLGLSVILLLVRGSVKEVQLSVFHALPHEAQGTELRKDEKRK